MPPRSDLFGDFRQAPFDAEFRGEPHGVKIPVADALLLKGIELHRTSSVGLPHRNCRRIAVRPYTAIFPTSPRSRRYRPITSKAAMTLSNDRSDRQGSVMPHTFDDAGGFRPCRETSSCEGVYLRGSGASPPARHLSDLQALRHPIR